MDPFTIGSIASAGLGALSSIFGKNKQQPQYQSPSQTPQYASLFQDPSQDPSLAGVYGDQSKNPVYSRLMSQMTSGLPQDYRDQVMGNAQTGAQNAYNSANSQLTFDEDRAQRTNSERMNKMGLLSSGAHGVSSGLVGEGYSRQRGTLAGNMQSQISQASTDLMGQDLAQRDRAMGLLSTMDTSRTNQQVGIYNSRQGRMAGLAQNDANMRYQAANNQYGNEQAQNAGLFQNLQSGASLYGLLGGGSNSLWNKQVKPNLGKGMSYAVR